MLPRKNDRLLPFARRLRREMTAQERRLWYCFLRYYPVKIYKQRIVGSFIADFYCHCAKLIIEIDGSQHFTDDGKAYDLERTGVLEQSGLRILRFTNADVDCRFELVCHEIERHIKNCLPLSPAGTEKDDSR